MHQRLKTELTHVFKYSDLEKLVKEIYDVEVDILNDLISFESRGQYTYHEFTVDGESELEDIDDDQIVADWIATGSYEMIESEWSGDSYTTLDVRHIMHRLFNDGHIPAGKYLMTVWW